MTHSFKMIVKIAAVAMVTAIASFFLWVRRHPLQFYFVGIYH